MSEKRLKIDLELHVVGDGRVFINFWNHINGDDVITELRDGKLYRIQYEGEDGKTETETEVSLEKFVEEVKSKFQ